MNNSTTWKESHLVGPLDTSDWCKNNVARGFKFIQTWRISLGIGCSWKILSFPFDNILMIYLWFSYTSWGLGLKWLGTFRRTQQLLNSIGPRGRERESDLGFWRVWRDVHESCTRHVCNVNYLLDLLRCDSSFFFYVRFLS